MSVKELFEYWQKYACLDSKFMPCNQDDEDLAFIVLSDLNPSHSETVFSPTIQYKARLLKIQHVDSGKRFIAKLVLDYTCNTEYFNYIEISKLSNGKLPHIMQLVDRRQIISDDDLVALHIMIMNEGVPLTRIYHNLNAHAEFNDMKPEFWLSNAFQLLYSIAFLHHNMFQHRDIHIGNIVYAKDSNAEPIEHYKVDDTYFAVKTEFLNVRTSLKLIDFGLSAYMLNDEEALNTTAYMIHSRPSDFIFSDGIRILSITNNDELFAYGLWLYFAIYRRFNIPQHPCKIKLIELIQKLTNDKLMSLYKDYEASTIADHAISLVLLMGFPPMTNHTFYSSPVGSFLYENRTWVLNLPCYNMLSMLPIDEDERYGKLHQILKIVLKWNRCDRPQSAKDLLLSPAFASLRTDATTKAWNAFI